MEKPVFNPKKLEIKNADLWNGNQMQTRFQKKKNKSVLYQIGKEVRL